MPESAVCLDAILRSVNGASLHHFSGIRRNDDNPGHRLKLSTIRSRRRLQHLARRSQAKRKADRHQFEQTLERIALGKVVIE